MTPTRITLSHLALRTAIVFVLISSAVMPQAFQGYTLYSPLDSKVTYLINMSNQVVKTWTHSISGGYSCYLLPDGALMRPARSTNSNMNGGGAAGIVQKIGWDGSVVWQYQYSSNNYRTHHDIEPLSNGNVLLIAWELKSAAQAVAAGLNHSASLWPEHILEIQPVGTNGGNVVWKWHAWDHFVQQYDPSKANYGVIKDHPELIDINLATGSNDWMHFNAISYNPDLDQIVVSSHFLDEIYVIDHSTTTAEAAGHTGGNCGKGGDILYRWGKPSNYGAPGAQVFKVVHGAWWIPSGLPGAGHIMAFNNRENQGTSMVVELETPVNGSGNYNLTPGQSYGPASPIWSYTAAGFYSNHLGGNQRLPNNNTLIVQSTSGKLFEVDNTGKVQWTYTPGGQIPRALRYPPNYSGLSQLPVELTSFSGLLVDRSVNLRWAVARETMNYGFEVQRFDEATNDWTVVAFIAGRGTTSIPNEYVYRDALPQSILSQQSVKYRLRQIDLDGTATLSTVVDVALDGVPLTIRLDQSYPNPMTSSATISYTLASDEFVRLEVIDAAGDRVATLVNDRKPAGTHSIRFDAVNLPSGIYSYTLTAGTKQITKRLIIVKGSK